MAFLPDSQRIAVGGIDVFSTGGETATAPSASGTCNTKLKDIVFDVGVYDFAVDPSGRYLAGAGLNQAVLSGISPPRKQSSNWPATPTASTPSPSIPTAATWRSAGDDLTVRLWDILSGRSADRARVRRRRVESLAFSPDGKSLFLGNANTTCYRVELKKFLED